jgi:hypothetical protein
MFLLLIANCSTAKLENSTMAKPPSEKMVLINAKSVQHELAQNEFFPASQGWTFRPAYSDWTSAYVDVSLGGPSLAITATNQSLDLPGVASLELLGLEAVFQSSEAKELDFDSMNEEWSSARERLNEALALAEKDPEMLSFAKQHGPIFALFHPKREALAFHNKDRSAKQVLRLD